jgi:hypothetical protein
VTSRRPDAGRLRGPGLLLLAILGTAALVSACGSGAASGRAQTASAATVSETCSQVSAVLSDGPDPQADPVGYAEAQILPLGQIRTSDGELRTAINGLAGAYREYFASERIDAICPGATS